MILIKQFSKKVLILLLEIKKQSKNIDHLLIKCGILLLPFSKIFILNSADFYIGKFSTFNTHTITLSTCFILIGSTIAIIRNKTQLSLNSKHYLMIFGIIGFLIYKNDPNIYSFIVAILLYIYLKDIATIKTKSILATLFIFSISIQIFIAGYQLITQESTNLKLLNFLGEPNIESSIKSISKLNINETLTIVRPYGTTQHPNILAGLILFSLIFITQTKKSSKLIKYLNMIGVYITGSIQGLLSLLLMIKKIQVKFIIIILGIILFTIKINSINYMGLIERVNELKNINLTLFGNSHYQLTSIHTKLLPWESQPIHNHFLHILNYYGLIIFLIFNYFLYKFLNSNKHIKKVFIYLLPIILLDHYLLTNPNMILATSLLINVDNH